MEDLTYTRIKSQEQYNEYSKKLRELTIGDDEDEVTQEHIELLMILIEKWDSEQFDGSNYDPVELIQSLKKDHNLAQKDLAKIAGVSPSYMSEMLNYKKRFPLDVVRKLSNYFKISQESLNKPYKLINDYPLEEINVNVFLKAEKAIEKKSKASSDYSKSLTVDRYSRFNNGNAEC